VRAGPGDEAKKWSLCTYLFSVCQAKKWWTTCFCVADDDKRYPKPPKPKNSDFFSITIFPSHPIT
jgi:hypothetical protein